MESIFIIRAISSDYDVSPWTVGWVETKEQSIEISKHMNEVRELAEKYRQKIWDYRSHLYDTVPREELEHTPSYPKWSAGIAQKDITTEMREERDRIKKLRDEIGVRNGVKNKKRYDEIERLAQEFINGLNLSSDVLEELKVEHVKLYDWYELEKLYI